MSLDIRAVQCAFGSGAVGDGGRSSSKRRRGGGDGGAVGSARGVRPLAWPLPRDRAPVHFAEREVRGLVAGSGGRRPGRPCSPPAPDARTATPTTPSSRRLAGTGRCGDSRRTFSSSRHRSRTAPPSSRLTHDGPRGKVWRRSRRRPILVMCSFSPVGGSSLYSRGLPHRRSTSRVLAVVTGAPRPLTAERTSTFLLATGPDHSSFAALVDDIKRLSRPGLGGLHGAVRP